MIQEGQVTNRTLMVNTNGQQNKSLHVLIADDDPDDRLMTSEALIQSLTPSKISFVEDGEELLDFLHQRGKYTEGNVTHPDLILLDLNMPKKNGIEALKEIKSDHELKHIPIVVLTTSKVEEDIYRTYDLGVNSFVTKPVSYGSLVNTMKIMGKYWFEVVRLPSERNTSRG
jgi:two-component system response regulator